MSSSSAVQPIDLVCDRQLCTAYFRYQLAQASGKDDDFVKHLGRVFRSAESQFKNSLPDEFWIKEARKFMGRGRLHKSDVRAKAAELKRGYFLRNELDTLYKEGRRRGTITNERMGLDKW